jgi:hypothetical protein
MRCSTNDVHGEACTERWEPRRGVPAGRIYPKPARVGVGAVRAGQDRLGCAARSVARQLRAEGSAPDGGSGPLKESAAGLHGPVVSGRRRVWRLCPPPPRITNTATSLPPRLRRSHDHATATTTPPPPPRRALAPAAPSELRPSSTVPSGSVVQPARAVRSRLAQARAPGGHVPSAASGSLFPRRRRRPCSAREHSWMTERRGRGGRACQPGAGNLQGLLRAQRGEGGKTQAGRAIRVATEPDGQESKPGAGEPRAGVHLQCMRAGVHV